MKELGLNFSPWYCECLGLDWKETLAAICELNPKIVRISAYFNKIVPDNDKDYDFDELDYLVDFLKQRKIKIILTVGIKAQRWPEFFIPKWMLHGFETPSSFFKELNSLKLYAIQENILKIIEKIVERYKSDIIFWQVENEPLQQSVPFLQAISAHFLNKEIEAVKKISASGKILLNETILTNNTLHRLNKLSKQFRINTGIEKFGEINAANVYSIMALNIYGRKLELLSHKKFNDVSNFK